MAAIITPRFRKNNAAAFLTDLTTAPSDYYIGLGRSEAWPTEASPPTPTGSPKELIEAKTALIQMKKIRSSIDGAGGLNSLSRMIPRVDWSSGKTFKVYSISDITSIYSSTSGTTITYPSYCINANKLYLCTAKGNGAGAAFTAPTHNTGSVANTSAGGDLYTWEYLMTLSSSTLNLQNFIAVSDAGIIEKLPSWYVGIAVDLYSNDLFIDTKYRQVSVVKFNNELTAPTDVNVVSAKHFVMNSAITPAVGSIITQTVAAYQNQATAQPRGIVVAVDGTKVYFSQTPAADGTVTAFTPGTGSTAISINGAALSTYSSIAETYTNTVPDPDVVFGVHTKTDRVPNGDIVFLDNRPVITHASGQVEEVRVVIQF